MENNNVSINGESILDSTKELLGIDSTWDSHFDIDVMAAINSTFMVLHQIGADDKPNAFFITGSGETWNDYMGDNVNIQALKTYVYLKVRQIFDPTASGVISEAYNNLLKEFEWRIYAEQDGFNK